MEEVQWKVDGMSCSNCALTIHKYLEKEGMKNVKVNYANGDVLFEMNGGQKSKEQIAKGIISLGYSVADQQVNPESKKPFLFNDLHRFLFCLPFTAVLMLHMIPGLRFHLLMNGWVQFCLLYTSDAADE